MKRAAEQYERTGKALLGREALARRKAAMNARAARYNGPMIGLVMLFALLLTWWFVAGVSGIAAKIPLGYSAGPVLLTVATTLALGAVWAKMMKAPDDAELGAAGLALCGDCGGFIPFRQGEALATCPYCQSRALKPATLAQQLLESGREALRAGEQSLAEAEEDNWRTAREARFAGIRFGVGGWVAVCILAACAMTGGIVAGLLSKSAATHATWWIWVALAAASAGMVLLVVRGVKRLIADNRDFERRFAVHITPGADVYRPR